MATEFISNSWLMPQNSNQDKLANYSLDFDGSSTYIETTENVLMDGGTEASISVWLNTEDKTATQVIVSTFDSKKYVEMSLISGGLYCWLGDGSTTSNYNIVNSTNLNIDNDTWYNFTLVYDGSQSTDGTRLKVYKNGSLLTWSTIRTIPTTLANDLTTNFYIGARNGASMFEGKITEVSIFDYALTSANITSIYGTGSAIGNPMSLSTKPVAYYPLGDSPFNGEFLATNNATELYENYALNFDGTNQHISLSSAIDLGINSTISVWLNTDQTFASVNDIVLGYNMEYPLYINNGLLHVDIAGGFESFTPNSMVKETWYNITIVRSGDSVEVFQNATSLGSQTGYGTAVNTYLNYIASRQSGSFAFDGKISNVSLFNTALSSTQITTLYNSGKPFDLNTFAVTPVAWWRLGGVNSSFDGTNWTVLDEIGTSNGTSANMPQSALVDGVGATGNGVSSGMSSGTNRSDAPYSSSNSVSYNMSVTAKSTSVPT